MKILQNLKEKIKAILGKKYYFFMKSLWSKRHSDLKQNYIIVSLGCNCLSRAIPTEWGLKPNKQQGEKTYPFDLSTHDIKGIIYLLENDFKDYFDTIRRTDTGEWFNDRFNFHYGHDADLKTIEEFKTRYENRINNFREMLKTDKNVIFIYNTRNIGIDTLEDLYNLNVALRKLRKNYRLFIITELDKYSSFKDDNAFLSYNPLPLPYPQYSWFESKHRHTKKGLKYEQGIMDSLYNYIKQYSKETNTNK